MLRLISKQKKGMSVIFIDQAEQMLFGWLLNQGKVIPDKSGKSLDLGCGSKPRNPFQVNSLVGCDIRMETPDIIECDIFKGTLPFNDNEFAVVTAFDFLEHIPRIAIDPNTRFPFIQIINEIYRILAPKGYFYSRTPAYPHPEAFQDPTHVNIITDKTFPVYFCGSQPLGSMYGFKGSFTMVFQSWHDYHLLTILQKEP